MLSPLIGLVGGRLVSYREPFGKLLIRDLRCGLTKGLLDEGVAAWRFCAVRLPAGQEDHIRVAGGLDLDVVGATDPTVDGAMFVSLQDSHNWPPR